MIRFATAWRMRSSSCSAPGGTDLTIFSPRASAMAHHIGNETTSRRWTQACNDLIHRVCSLYPGTSSGFVSCRNRRVSRVVNSAAELERCVRELGFIGCNLNPDPSGGHWTSPPLTDRHWYPLYEKMVELDVPGHGAREFIDAIRTFTLPARIITDTTAFMQFHQRSIQALSDAALHHLTAAVRCLITGAGTSLPRA